MLLGVSREQGKTEAHCKKEKNMANGWDQCMVMEVVLMNVWAPAQEYLIVIGMCELAK